LKLLTKQEVQLAKRELGERLTIAQRQVSVLALGVAALAAGLLVLLAASVLTLALVMPAWSAALLVGGVVNPAAGFAIAGGAGLILWRLVARRRR
jgi:hypothetical protein